MARVGRCCCHVRHALGDLRAAQCYSASLSVMIYSGRSPLRPQAVLQSVCCSQTWSIDPCPFCWWLPEKRLPALVPALGTPGLQHAAGLMPVPGCSLYSRQLPLLCCLEPPVTCGRILGRGPWEGRRPSWPSCLALATISQGCRGVTVRAAGPAERSPGCRIANR